MEGFNGVNSWRLRGERLGFKGEECEECGTKIFPLRDVCPADGVVLSGVAIANLERQERHKVEGAGVGEVLRDARSWSRERVLRGLRGAPVKWDGIRAVVPGMERLEWEVGRGIRLVRTRTAGIIGTLGRVGVGRLEPHVGDGNFKVGRDGDRVELLRFYGRG
jgi:hypothetical protein